MSDPAGAAPTFVADVEGTYIYRLVVTKGSVESKPDYVNVMARSVLEVEWTVPEDGDAAVNTSTPLIVAFSASVQPSSVHAGTIGTSDEASAAVPSAIALEPGNKIAVLTPVTALAAGTRYKLTVSQGVTDSFGVTMQAPVIVWFTTAAAGADVIPPHVVATVPADQNVVEAGAVVRVVFSEPLAAATVTTSSFTMPSGNATCVPRETGIWVTFSQPVLEGSLTSETIGIYEGTTPVPSLRELDHDTATVHLLPSDTLAFGTSYSVELTIDVEAEAGGMLPTSVSSPFGTLSRAGCAGNLACMVDADCPAQICSATGVCVDECAVPEDCPDPQVCNAGTCQ
ncbi:MAG: Ig-like domain-containing protein [Myxococcota bacterium]